MAFEKAAYSAASFFAYNSNIAWKSQEKTWNAQLKIKNTNSLLIIDLPGGTIKKELAYAIRLRRIFRWEGPQKCGFS